MKAVGAAVAVTLAASTMAAPSPRPFDPTLDPVFQLRQARSAAMKQHKNLLLDIGGNWCVGCLILDRLLEHDPRVSRLLASNYVLVHVNVSPENINASFLSRFPKANGYPYLIVLGPDGSTVIHTEGSLALQRGAKAAQQGYDPAAIAQFLLRWKPGRA
jgi:thiol:disulfide interchange protein